MPPVIFACDCGLPASALPHVWEHTVGSGHATLALRADWQAQLKRAHGELGFDHVRFHGILDEDMGTFMIVQEKPLYSFFNADQIFDFLLSIGMKPFVELSFMPDGLASGTKSVFHYRGNVTPPRDYAAWGALIGKLVAHWVDRYGLAEVSQWFFEVWNEPNLEWFGTGKIEDYLKLYASTAQAVKSVHPSLRVGGPATAANAWLPEFQAACRAQSLPLDFLTTHHYPTDSFGQPGDDTETQLADSRRSVLREEAAQARREAGALPLYYTEWCTSSNPRDTLHDRPFAAAFIVKTVLEAATLVDGYSYWTFSDIFEENYFPSVPFHGGFGLLTIHGIAKPAYRAFQLLHELGDRLLPVTGAHDTVDAWAVRSEGFIDLVLTNFALPRHDIASEEISFTLTNLPGLPRRATVRRIDETHANPRARWEAMGMPDYLSPQDVATLQGVSELAAEAQSFEFDGKTLALTVTLPPLAVAVIRLDFGS